MRRTDRMQGPKFWLVVADATVLLNPLSLTIWGQCVCVLVQCWSVTLDTRWLSLLIRTKSTMEREKKRESY